MLVLRDGHDEAFVAVVAVTLADDPEAARFPIVEDPDALFRTLVLIPVSVLVVCER